MYFWKASMASSAQVESSSMRKRAGLVSRTPLMCRRRGCSLKAGLARRPEGTPTRLVLWPGGGGARGTVGRSGFMPGT